MDQPSPRRQRLVGMDALRAVAFFMIFAFHNWQNCGSPHLLVSVLHRQPFSVGWLLSQGAHGTSVFFVISGFLLALPYWRGRSEGVGTFFWRRLRRIYPPYLAAIAVYVIILTHRGWTHDRWAADVVLHLTLLHNLFEFSAFGVSPPLWYMATQVQLYFVVPIFFALLRRISGQGPRALATGLFWVICGVSVLAVRACLTWMVQTWSLPPELIKPDGLVLMTSSLVRVAEFATGMALAGVLVWLGAARRLWHWAIPVALLAAARVIPLAWTMPLHQWPRLPLTIGAIVLAVSMVQPRSALARVLESPPVRWLGAISFGSYLYHGLALVMVHGVLAARIAELAPENPLWVRSILALAASLIMGAASYLIVERCVQPWLLRRTAQQSTS